MEKGEVDELGLITMMKGLAVERFDDELVRLLANVVDPNTNATTKRSITVKVSFKPDKSRSIGDMELEVSSKLAAPDKVSNKVFFAMTRNGVVASEHNPYQPDLPVAEPAATVTQLRAVTNGGA